MKNRDIEERAKKAYPIDGTNMMVGLIQRNSYILGATDQKTIDNDKAKEAFNKACGWLSTYTWYNEVFEEFIKNIEE